MRVQRLANVLVWLGGLSCVVGIGFLNWASTRQHEDLARSYGYALGLLGLVGGLFLLLLTAAVLMWGRTRDR